MRSGVQDCCEASTEAKHALDPVPRLEGGIVNSATEPLHDGRFGGKATSGNPPGKFAVAQALVSDLREYASPHVLKAVDVGFIHGWRLNSRRSVCRVSLGQ